MEASLGEAFWRVEAELLGPSRSLKGFTQTLLLLQQTVETKLQEDSFTPEQRTLIRQGTRKP